jgi:hypothetical protein
VSIRIDHGTRRGFQQHQAIGAMVCEACAEANRTYMRDYLRARYTPEARRAKYERDKARRGKYWRLTLEDDE